MKSIDEKPSFLITIDVEGDNLWSSPKKITTENAKNLPRFQNLCEKYGFKPTYLPNYEMVISPIFQEFAKYIIKRNTAEIGMHLHAWNTPPIYKLTKNDFKYRPYLIEYPKKIMEKKIKYFTNLLEEIFKIKILSHRAGRWCLNEIYAQLLIKYGYCVDCSVTPYVSWENVLGDPNQKGGSNYIYFPNKSYFLNLNSISKPGTSSLLEIPITIIQNNNMIHRFKKIFNFLPLIKKGLDYLFPTIFWFRPKKNNINSMLNLLNWSINGKKNYIEFMLHSSELMVGCNRTFKTKKDIEKLYKNLEYIFKKASKSFVGRTLIEYYNIKKNK